jgi:hypothetical protein
MQIARNNAYRPDLVLEKKQVNFTWGKGMNIMHEENLNPDFITMKVYNIGVGTAKNVSIQFDLESLDNLAETIEKTDQNDTFKYERTGDYISLTEDACKSMFFDDYIWEKQFILPDAQKETELYFPQACQTLLNRVFKKPEKSITNASLHLIVAYEDVQGKEYHEDIFLDCTSKYLAHDSSDNGSCGYTIESRIN